MTLTVNATPIVGWDTDRVRWLDRRAHGCGASDVAALLGLTHWATPLEMWLEKTRRARPDTRVLSPTQLAAVDLGNRLEGWLLDQTGDLLGVAAVRTFARTYAHLGEPWRTASPDGELNDDSGALVEAKTAGLASGWGIADGWEDNQVPLAYELQARWQMHVLDRPLVHVVALVAHLGLIHRIVQRDPDLEADLVDQVSTWWDNHVVNDLEPPAGRHDAPLLSRMYPPPDKPWEVIELTSDEWEVVRNQRAKAKRRRDVAAGEVDEIDNRIRQQMGAAVAVEVDGRVRVTWSPRKGQPKWQAIAAHLAEQAGHPLPNPDDREGWRGRPTRALNYK